MPLPIRPSPHDSEDRIGFFHRSVRSNGLLPFTVSQQFAATAGGNQALAAGLLDCALLAGGHDRLRGLIPSLHDPDALTFAPAATRMGVALERVPRQHALHEPGEYVCPIGTRTPIRGSCGKSPKGALDITCSCSATARSVASH